MENYRIIELENAKALSDAALDAGASMMRGQNGVIYALFGTTTPVFWFTPIDGSTKYKVEYHAGWVCDPTNELDH